MSAFARFPSFRFGTEEVAELVEWMRDDARAVGAERAAGFHGLDPFGTSAALAIALERLDEIDPDAATAAGARWATLTPWRRSAFDLLHDGASRDVEDDVIALMLRRFDAHRAAMREEGPRSSEAAEAAWRSAEAYYRALFHGAPEAWTLRAEAMASALRARLADYGPSSKAVVWARFAQAADAAATETSARGHRSLGQLCRRAYGPEAYLVGLAADHGAALAASSWGARARAVPIRPSLDGSYEHALHVVAEDLLAGGVVLPLRAARRELHEALLEPRLAREIGPVYQAERELAAHTFTLSLPLAFDDVVFVDETTPVEPIERHAFADPSERRPLVGSRSSP